MYQMDTIHLMVLMISFNATTKELTLNERYSTKIHASGDLKIVIVGTNSVSSDSESSALLATEEI